MWGRREKLAQKVGRRELYCPVPPPLLYANIFFLFSPLTQELLNYILRFNFVKRPEQYGSKSKRRPAFVKKTKNFHCNSQVPRKNRRRSFLLYTFKFLRSMVRFSDLTVSTQVPAVCQSVNYKRWTRKYCTSPLENKILPVLSPQ